MISNFPCPFNCNCFLFTADRSSFQRQRLPFTAYPSCKTHPVPKMASWTCWPISVQLCRRSTTCCECLPSFVYTQLHMQCNVWDAHMGSVIPMTATAVPFYHMQHASPGTMHDSAAVYVESVVKHCRHAICRMQVVDRRMVHESDVYANEGHRLSDDALCEEVLDKVLLHRSCLVRKLCQPSAYGCNPDKVHHCHHASCGSKSCLKTMLLLLHLLSCSCCCALVVALHGRVLVYGQTAFFIWAL